jgi:hypothetical protein
MITKLPLQKIIQGILHTENERKKNHERVGNIKPNVNEKQESKK